MAHGDFTAGEILTAANLNTHLDEKLDLAGGTMTGNLDMTNFAIVGVTKLEMADTLSLADDEAARIQFDTTDTRGMVLVVGNLASAGMAICGFRVGSGSAFVNVLASSGATVTGATGSHTGATGTDGELTIAARTGTNFLDIENRTGAARGYSFAFLCFATGELVDGSWTIN